MFLEKKDVSIYYEVRGTGDPLLLVHGTIVDAGLYEKGAELLSRHFRVITYDRRGMSRSAFPKGVDGPISMDDQAEDIKDLLDELGIDQAYIFGASAGGAISLHFLQKYPERVRHLIAYESAIHNVLTEPEEREPAWIAKAKELIAKKRFNAAVLEFAQGIGAADPRASAKTPEESIREYGNIVFSLGKELYVTLDYQPDIELLYKHRDKITIAAGEQNQETIYHPIAETLGRLLEMPVVYYPGGHNFPFDRPREFAICVMGTLMMTQNGQIL